MHNIDRLVMLIEAVKNHPTLFTNSTQSDHEDLKEWTAVAEESKMTVSEAQDQWNLLLLEYVEYLRNNQDFNLAQHMDFLQPYFFTIKDGETIDEDELLAAIDSKVVNESSHIVPIINEKEIIKSDLKEITKTQQTPNEETSSKTLNHTTQSKVPESSSSEITSQNSSFTNLSSLELIFLGYAKQLQKMPLHLQLKTKRKIADIMDEAELQMMS